EALAGGARFLIGPVFATTTAAAAPVAQAGQVAMVSFSTDSRVAGGGGFAPSAGLTGLSGGGPDAAGRAAGRNVFVMGFLPELEVARVIAYAAAEGHRRFAVLAPANDYGQAVLRAARQAIPVHGGVLVQAVLYDPAGDATPVVRQLADYDRRAAALAEERAALTRQGGEVAEAALKRLEGRDTLGDVDFDAILVPEGGPALMALAPLLPFFDIDPARVRLLGTGRWDDLRIATEPALRGGWFAGAPAASREAWAARYESLFGEAPPRRATLAYDATALAAVLAREAEGGDFSIAALTRPGGFAGIDGLFRFLPDGRVERGLAILQVGDRVLSVVEPAPASFPTGASGGVAGQP
ncbi:MAG: penicillin-binding protein activator, partial [Alphaproteobacteria bacterium]